MLHTFVSLCVTRFLIVLVLQTFYKSLCYKLLVNPRVTDLLLVLVLQIFKFIFSPRVTDFTLVFVFC